MIALNKTVVMPPLPTKMLFAKLGAKRVAPADA
jgi:hypothetical protein